MMERLQRGDWRLLLLCLLVGAASLWVGVRYYALAFPEATIEFRLTRQQSEEVAARHAHELKLPIDGLRHASVFDYDNTAKTFLERETGVEETNRRLDSTVRIWRWRHRWFKPLQKEEVLVDLTTRGEFVGFEHLLAEEAPGASLAEPEARSIAERFLTTTMARPLDGLTFLEGSREERPHRVDYLFTWKVTGSEVKGGDYRLAVGIAGDQLGSYTESLHVPDEWTRGYQQLRSRNDVAGAVDAVFLALTAVGMIVVLVLRLRHGDVRWRTAALLGTITFVLVFASQLDELPAAIFSYDTTASFGGFLLRELLQAVAAAAALGAAILLIAASAEPLYRESQPQRLSVGALLGARAFRTKEAFLATAAGLTATCFFFAYENVFYIVANRFGAWSPRDVPYSDLLSAAVPWAYVLFFGWFPAISEEFISRMFSLPFLRQLFRSRIVAVLLASAIWGFGHAGYPNQPFWIRGLEVGMAGVLFCLLFFRFGILAAVVCHFSVDALYTAFVLIRSDSLYYQITGGAAAGIWGLAFLGMAVAYVRRGGFVPAERTNAAETAAEEAKRAAEETERRQVLAQAGFAGAEGAGYADGGGAFGAAGPHAARIPALLPLGRARLAVGLVAALGLAALAFAPLGRFGDWTDFGVTRDGAERSAATFLRSVGMDTAGTRAATVTLDRTDSSEAAYLLQTGGMETARTVYRELLPTPLWRVRFYRPGEQTEWRVSVMPRDGQVVGFVRELPENGPGESLEDEPALRLAEAFARSHGQDPASGLLREQTRRDEKARRDHTLVWDFPITGAGEAAVRTNLVVQGEEVGSWTRGLKLPEQWERERDRKTAFTELLRWGKLPFFIIAVGTATLAFVRAIRRGAVPWRFALIAGGIACVPATVSFLLGLEGFWARQYETALPAATFAVMLGVGAFFRILLVFGGVALAVGLAGALYPGAVAALSWRGGARGDTAARALPPARDTFLGIVLSAAAALGLPPLARLVAALVPGGALLQGVPVPSAVDSAFPALTVLCDAALAALVVPALAAIAGGVLRDYFPETWQRAGLFALFLVSLLSPDARTARERLSSALFVAVFAGGAILLARLFLRTDAPAWVWGVAAAVGALGVDGLAGQSAPYYRGHAAVAAVVLLAALGVLLARASRRERTRATPAGP